MIEGDLAPIVHELRTETAYGRRPGQEPPGCGPADGQEPPPQVPAVARPMPYTPRDESD